MKVRIEIDENMSEDEIVIRCAQPDERVLKMKRAAESTEGDPEIAFFKDAVQFYCLITIHNEIYYAQNE